MTPDPPPPNNCEIVDELTGVVTAGWVEKNLRRIGAIT